MGIVGDDKGVVSFISNSVLDVWSIIYFWYWWEALLLQVALIGLLGDKKLHLGSNFLTDFDSFRICVLRIEGGVFHAGHKLRSLGTF